MVCLLRCNSYFCLLLQQINSLPITYIIAVTLLSSSDPVTSFCRLFSGQFYPLSCHFGTNPDTPQNQHRHFGTKPSPPVVRFVPIAQQKNKRALVSQTIASESIK